MNEFKKGDKIRIKDEVSSKTHRYEPPTFIDSMDRMKNKVLTIRDFTNVGNIKVEDSDFILHPDWVEPVKEFKKGDKIRIKDEVSSKTHRGMSPHFVEWMDGLKDKVLTFSGFTQKGNLKIEERIWVLHPDWVEKVSEWTSAPEDDFGSTLAEAISRLSEELEGLTDGDRASILEEAQEILEGERDSDYGDPVANFGRIARIASSILDEYISPEQCVVVMMAVKLSREQYKHKRDNLVDLVAYIEILNRIKELNK